MDQALSTIEALCRQEQQYMVVDDNETEVNEDFRATMVTWAYKIVDYCGFHRETVEMALNYVDRFVLTKAGASALTNLKDYQLATVASLYIAVKVYEPEVMGSDFLSRLSRGTYSAQQVEAMELKVLCALQWRVCPPTAISFVRLFLELLPPRLLSPQQFEAVYLRAQQQVELSVSEYNFCKIKPSTLAFCALMNAFQSLGIHETLRKQIANGFSHSIGMKNQSSDSSCTQQGQILQVQKLLYKAAARQRKVGGGSSVSSKTSAKSVASSPSVVPPPAPESPRSVVAAKTA